MSQYVSTKIKIVFSIVLIMLIGAIIYAVSTKDKYDEKWMLGKTQEQIVQEYGEFERMEDNVGIYLLRERKVGFLGTDAEIECRVYFTDGCVSKVRYEYGAKGGL